MVVYLSPLVNADRNEIMIMIERMTQLRGSHPMYVKNSAETDIITTPIPDSTTPKSRPAPVMKRIAVQV